MGSTAPGVAGRTSDAGSKNYTPALAILTTLFFMWGFLTCLNDISRIIKANYQGN